MAWELDRLILQIETKLGKPQSVSPLAQIFAKHGIAPAKQAKQAKPVQAAAASAGGAPVESQEPSVDGIAKIERENYDDTYKKHGRDDFDEYGDEYVDEYGEQ